MPQTNINLGSTQAPYWEQVIELKPNEIKKIQYVTDNFQLLEASTPNALKVSFGGSMIQTPFSAGMGYRLTEPVQFIELWNNSDVYLKVDFVIGIGEIKDNRLTISGQIQTVTQNKMFAKISAGTINVSNTYNYTLSAGNSVSLCVTSGELTFNANSNGINFNNLILSGGQSLDFTTANDLMLTITGSGSFNYFVGEY